MDIFTPLPSDLTPYAREKEKEMLEHVRRGSEYEDREMFEEANQEYAFAEKILNEICEECEGEGQVLSYRPLADEPVYKCCPFCSGSGIKF